MKRSIREYLEIPDFHGGNYHGKAVGDDLLGDPEMENSTYPYDMPDENDGETVDDLDFAISIDAKAGITRNQAPISDSRSRKFVDGSERIHENTFTALSRRNIGSHRSTYTLRDLFDDEGRYMKKVKLDVRAFEALRPCDIHTAPSKRN